MDLNICKKCEKNCFIYKLDCIDDNFFISIRQDNIIYENIYFEEKNDYKPLTTFLWITNFSSR